MTPPSRPFARARARSRGVAPLEAALGFAIIGSVLAVGIPAFVRDLHASRFSEATEGLAAIGEGAVLYAAPLPVDKAFPMSAPMTPPHPARGGRAVDMPGLWQTPTWMALHFPPPRRSGRAFAEDEAHSFAFVFESTSGPHKSTFVARAHGDLDGDGTLSTFEIRGHDIEGDARGTGGPSVEPGMYVENPLE